MDILAIALGVFVGGVALFLWIINTLQHTGNRDPIEAAERMEEDALPVKLWLDDEGPCPAGWLHIDRPSTAIRIMQRVKVDSVSLGIPDGVTILSHIENEMHAGRHVPVTIQCHAWEYSVRAPMEARISDIQKQIWETSIAHFHVNRDYYSEDRSL